MAWQAPQDDEVITPTAKAWTPPASDAVVSPSAPSFTDKIKLAAQIVPTVINRTLPVAPGIVRAAVNPEDAISSAGSFAKNAGEAIMHPIDTAKLLGKTAGQAVSGAIDKAQGKKTLDSEAFDRLAQFFKNRYGSVEALNNTIAKDPVGFAADASTVLGIGGAAAAKAGEVSKIGTIAKLGEAAGEAGKAVEPINAAMKTAGAAGSLIGAGTKRLAAMTAALDTGKPSDAFLQAMDNPTPEFFKYLRDKAPAKELVDQARQSFHAIGNKEGEAYRAQLNAIREGSDLASELDVSPIKKRMDEKLLNFEIARTGKPQTIKTPEETIKLKNGIDFSNSSLQLDPKAQAEVAKVVAKVDSLGQKEGSLTPIQLDMTKRAINRLYSENSDARAFVASVGTDIDRLLKDKVAGYDKMVARYDDWKEFQNDFESALISKDRVAADKAFSKLSSLMRENADMKKQIMNEFISRGGKDLRPALAGQALSQWQPNYLRTAIAGTAAGGVGKLLATPFLWPVVALTSPRIAGEFFGAIGFTKSKIKQITAAISASKAGTAAIRAIPNVGEAAFQAGRAKNDVFADQAPQDENQK